MVRTGPKDKFAADRRYNPPNRYIGYKLSDCIKWHLYIDRKSGYGQKRHNGKLHWAHRWVYSQHHGLDLERLDVIMHTCDNPSCVNPAHLVLGTHADNSRDMVQKGRQSRRVGIDNPAAALTEADVMWMRENHVHYSKEFGTYALARKFNVAPSAAWNAVNRVTWSHI